MTIQKTQAVAEGAKLRGQLTALDKANEHANMGAKQTQRAADKEAKQGFFDERDAAKDQEKADREAEKEARKAAEKDAENSSSTTTSTQATA